MFNDPLQLFAAAADALAKGEWFRAAAYCDPDSLAAFKAEAERRYDPYASHNTRALTPDDYLRYNPTMPREVAEYLTAQHRSRPSLSAELRGEFPGLPTYEHLLHASDQEVFAAWLRGRSLRHQLEDAIARDVLQAEYADAALAEAGTEYHFRLIGWLPEGDRIAHVLFREALSEEASVADEADDRSGEGEYRIGLGTDAAPLIATCRRQPDGTWRLVASYTFFTRSASGWFGLEAEGEAQPDHPEADGA